MGQASVPTSSAINIEALAATGLNIVAVDASHGEIFSTALNDGLRQGVMVIADMKAGPASSPSEVLSTASAAALIETYSCHPAFWGAVLRRGAG